MARASRNPFWAYSLRLYKKPGVAPACLALQDKLGVDVNLVLFCLWAGSRGTALPARLMAQAVVQSRSWAANIVTPLRGVRRFLKPMNVDAYRRQVARIELAAEKLQQQALYALAPPSGGKGSRDAAERNLDRYFKAARLRPRPPDRAVLAAIVALAFPGRTSASK
jgi:uncharacterized protein (TIGR02444 family)